MITKKITASHHGWAGTGRTQIRHCNADTFMEAVSRTGINGVIASIKP